MRLATPRDPEAAEEVVVLRFLLVKEAARREGMALAELEDGVAEYCRVSGAVSIPLGFLPCAINWAYSGLGSLGLELDAFMPVPDSKCLISCMR